MKGSRYYNGCYSADKAVAKIITYCTDGSVIDVNYFGDRKRCDEDYDSYLKLSRNIGIEYLVRDGRKWISIKKDVLF